MVGKEQAPSGFGGASGGPRVDNQWSSSRGFVLATLGSAIGLGNIWRFSYVVGEHGGGAFILVYLAAVVGLGLPLLIAELAIGQRTRTNAIAAFEKLSAARPWRWAGWLGVTVSVAILSYYPVIAGWVARYLVSYAVAQPQDPTGAGFAASFEAFVADPYQPVFWHGIVIIAAGAVVAAGVERGIELASRILMPVFAVLIVLLAGYGLSLPGASQALEFLFLPDWSVLLHAGTYLAAVGQAFFSIGLAMAIFVTFGSYLPRGVRLPHAALAIVAGDTFVAVIAGVMIFSAVFSYGLDPAHGPTLAFVVLPEVFSVMPAGRWFAVGFFFLLLVAALTSVIALLEVPVSLVMAKLRWRRPRAAVVVSAAAFLLGVPSALGYGAFRSILTTVTPLLDVIDYVSLNVILPLSGIAVALFAGWVWSTADALEASGLVTRPMRHLWLWSLRVVVPVTIGLVMIRGLGLI
ncbi:MAG: neurotransmitter:Na+ symporter NSS family [Rhodospirillaceae bacterium]|nr:MAG: neurotransmitter:Na+ symporter NSS family [Rhodospirillaceae bacterium]